MHLIQPSVTIIEEKDPFKKIEMAARTCYKSTGNGAEDSAKKMFSRLASSQHTAMMEHATFVFQLAKLVSSSTLQRIRANKFLHLTTNPEENRILASGNLRALNECNIPSLLFALKRYDPMLVYTDFLFDDEMDSKVAEVVDFEALENKSPLEIREHRYTTMRFITNRSISHEAVRHRLFSFAQASQRYINYNADKFGGGDIAFIEPAGFNEWPEEVQTAFLARLEDAEKAYNQMIGFGLKPQQARALLPNAANTEIVITGNDAEWQHFFNLRSKGTTGAPDPDMKRVADIALSLYEERYKK